MVENLPAMWETLVGALVEKILWRRAWKSTAVFFLGESPWTEEPGGLQSMGMQRVRYDRGAKHSTAHTSISISLYIYLNANL